MVKLLLKYGFEVIFIARSEDKAKEALQDIAIDPA